MGKFNIRECKPRLKEVDISAWTGQKMFVQEFSGVERNRIMTLSSEKAEENYGEYSAEILILCAVDASGNKLFTEEDKKEIDKLPSKMVDKIVEEVMEINGLQPKAIEEEKENFTESQSDDSATS